MKLIKFSYEQEEYLCELIDVWYQDWKKKMTDGAPHYLGIAKEQLKQFICEQKIDTSLEMLVRENDKDESK